MRILKWNIEIIVRIHVCLKVEWSGRNNYDFTFRKPNLIIFAGGLVIVIFPFPRLCKEKMNIGE